MWRSLRYSELRECALTAAPRGSRERLQEYGFAASAVFQYLVKPTTLNFGRLSPLLEVKVRVEVHSSSKIIRAMRDALISEVNESRKFVGASMFVKGRRVCVEASSTDASNVRAWLSSCLRLMKVSHEVSLLVEEGL